MYRRYPTRWSLRSDLLARLDWGVILNEFGPQPLPRLSGGRLVCVDCHLLIIIVFNKKWDLTGVFIINYRRYCM